MMEAPSTLGRGGDTLVKKNTVLVVGGTGTLGRQVLGMPGHNSPCSAPPLSRLRCRPG